MGKDQCDQIWYIFLPYPVGWAWTPNPCFKDLQHLKQEGVVPPNLSSFGKTNCTYDHTGKDIVHPPSI